MQIFLTVLPTKNCTGYRVGILMIVYCSIPTAVIQGCSDLLTDLLRAGISVVPENKAPVRPGDFTIQNSNKTFRSRFYSRAKTSVGLQGLLMLIKPGTEICQPVFPQLK